MFVNTPLAWLATRGSPWPVARRSHQQDTCGGRWLRLAGPARAHNGRSARQPACPRSIDPTLGRDQCCWLTEAMMLTGSAYLSASMVPGRISLHGAIGKGGARSASARICRELEIVGGLFLRRRGAAWSNAPRPWAAPGLPALGPVQSRTVDRPGRQDFIRGRLFVSRVQAALRAFSLIALNTIRR
jgi:hypothetical protein